jgi:hypothetical protein
MFEEFENKDQALRMTIANCHERLNTNWITFRRREQPNSNSAEETTETNRGVLANACADT